MASRKPTGRDARELGLLLGSPEVADLIRDLDDAHWTGRRGYPMRAMVGMALAKSLYAIPTWTRTVVLVQDHRGLRRAIGCPRRWDVPSVDACYRFTKKLRKFKPLLGACIDSVLRSLQDEMPELGTHVAIDGSDMPAYANGQRYLSKNGPERKVFSDPDASWGHRSSISVRKGGGFYGYKLHAAVCTVTGLPIGWHVATAKDAEVPLVPSLLDTLVRRGFVVETCAMDKGYDANVIYDGCESRGIRPIVPLRRTGRVLAGDHLPPSCDHGTWTFAGSDFKRGASKWRCPTGECSPASKWVKADRLHPLVPRETDRWKKLYRGRAGVEREFGA